MTCDCRLDSERLAKTLVRIVNRHPINKKQPDKNEETYSILWFKFWDRGHL